MLRAIVLMGVLLAVGVTTQSAQAQGRAALCESEADAEQVFAYLRTAVEAGDRTGANACADAYLELAPRGAHVREANELVASMSERQATDALQDHAAPAAAPERSQQYAHEDRLPPRPRHFLSLSSGLQRQVLEDSARPVVSYGEADFGQRITIGGGGKISLVEERAYQLSVVVGHEGWNSPAFVDTNPDKRVHHARK